MNFRTIQRKKAKGVSLMEYALIASLIAVVSIIALRDIGTNTKDALNKVATEMKIAG